MYQDTEKFVDLDFEQRVRQAAYHLWEQDGRPIREGDEVLVQGLERLLDQRATPETPVDSSAQTHA